MIKITTSLYLVDSELKFNFIRSPGPGGQNVNKVATGVELRFDVRGAGSLSENLKERLSRLAGSKLTLQGELIIKATRFRTQERNKQDAVNRLKELIQRAAIVPKKRKKTKPTRASVERRLSSKKKHSLAKNLRSGRGEY